MHALILLIMAKLIDVCGYPAVKLIHTPAWSVIKGSSEPCDLWRLGRVARAVPIRAIPLLWIRGGFLKEVPKLLSSYADFHPRRCPAVSFVQDGQEAN